jgi:hypothetical protein
MSLGILNALGEPSTEEPRLDKQRNKKFRRLPNLGKNNRWIAAKRCAAQT